MLKWNLITFNFLRFSQSGMFIDFIVKQFTEYLVRNWLIYTALFFGEKYVIEYLTKKTIDSYVFNSNRLFLVYNLSYQVFMKMTVSFIFYFIFFILIIFCFL